MATQVLTFDMNRLSLSNNSSGGGHPNESPYHKSFVLELKMAMLQCEPATRSEPRYVVRVPVLVPTLIMKISFSGGALILRLQNESMLAMKLRNNTNDVVCSWLSFSAAQEIWRSERYRDEHTLASSPGSISRSAILSLWGLFWTMDLNALMSTEDKLLWIDLGVLILRENHSCS